MKSDDYKELARLTSTGDSAAASLLFDLQRQGKALRVYHEPRTGIDHDGFTPIIMEVDAYGLIRLQAGTGDLFGLSLRNIAPWCRALRQAIGISAQAGLENPHAYRAHLGTGTEGFSFDVRAVLENEHSVESIQLRFHPVGAKDWTFDAFVAVKMLFAITNLMDNAMILPDQCGFESYDEFEEILAVAESTLTEEELLSEDDL